MTKFSATFSNGETVTRKSDRDYSFAWAVIRIADSKIVEKGFSADRANAEKSAKATMRPVGQSARHRRNAALNSYNAKLAKDRGFASVNEMQAAWDASAIAHNAARRIEIVAL